MRAARNGRAAQSKSKQGEIVHPQQLTELIELARASNHVAIAQLIGVATSANIFLSKRASEALSKLGLKVHAANSGAASASRSARQ